MTTGSLVEQLTVTSWKMDIAVNHRQIQLLHSGLPADGCGMCEGTQCGGHHLPATGWANLSNTFLPFGSIWFDVFPLKKKTMVFDGF